MKSLYSSTHLNLTAALWPWGELSLQQDFLRLKVLPGLKTDNLKTFSGPIV
jgi:hypothetical protein